MAVTNPAMLSPEERQAIEAKHRNCDALRVQWPLLECDSCRLLATLRAVEEERDRARANLEITRAHHALTCEHCEAALADSRR